MEPKDQVRALRISGLNVAGEPVDVDYSLNLMNVVLFFEPVSKNSLDVVELVRLMSERYSRLSVGFWYVMEPRLSCLYRSLSAQRTLDRLSLFSNVLFDANNMIVLQSGVRVVPAVIVVDSNGLICSQFEGEISLLEIERTVQARIALSGYKDELPLMSRFDAFGNGITSELSRGRSGSVMRQLGYATGDYVFGSVIAPETNQEFSLPDYCLINTIYPFGAWFVGRDSIAGNSGSTVYVSCARDESVTIFAGAEAGATLRIHTSIESPQNMVFGKDVKKSEGSLEMKFDEFWPYEVLLNSGDSDLLISLQIMSGTAQLYSVEFCPTVYVPVNRP